MIRLTGVYRLSDAATHDQLDLVTDQIMGVLMLDTTIMGPDVAVSLPENVLQVEMAIDIDDPWKASKIGELAMRAALEAASVSPPDKMQRFMHRDFLKKSHPVKLQAELVGV